ncbi:aldehyde dehydrogenase family protein, partial [Escherichia coli]|nr:aldehyde dehydrogenase family protein [Escherichia coli]
MHRQLQHFIDGAWVDSDGGRTHAVTDPATEQPVTEITLGSAADVDRAVAAARRAFDAFAQTSVDERAALLDRIADGMKARAADLAKAISEEMGAPIAFAQAAQVPAGIGHFLATARALREFTFEERIGKARV